MGILEERVGVSTIRIKFLDGPRSAEPDMVFDGLDQIQIGRSVDCHVLLPMPDVSHHHATLIRRGGQWGVVDTSRTGTWLNGHRVTRQVRLASGDTLTIGSQRLRVEIQDDVVSSLTSETYARRTGSPVVTDSGSVTRMMPRAPRRGPSQSAVREAVRGVPPGELPGPEALEDMPRSVLLYWYVHAWRMYQQTSERQARSDTSAGLSNHTAEEVAGLKQRLQEAEEREAALKARVNSLEQALAAREDIDPVPPPAGPEAVATPDTRAQLAELKAALGDFQGLVNKLADLLGSDAGVSPEVANLMGEMSALLLSMEYLIEGLGVPEGEGGR